MTQPCRCGEPEVRKVWLNGMPVGILDMLSSVVDSRQPLEREAIRLVALDLDGTLLCSDGSISARTHAALERAEQTGVAVVSITARPPRRVRELAERVGLAGNVICANGALTYDLAGDRLVRQELLASEVAEPLIARLRDALPGVAFMVEAGLQYGCEPGYVIQHARDHEDPHMRRADALLLCRDGVSKLIVQHAAHALDDLLRLVQAHAGDLASVTHSGSNFVEVAAAGVTKALALQLYCEERGIRACEVVAFGDMPNDLPMLAWAGHGVAMGNAHPEVLAAADEVTTSNDQDGIALVLERLAQADYAVPT